MIVIASDNDYKLGQILHNKLIYSAKGDKLLGPVSMQIMREATVDEWINCILESGGNRENCQQWPRTKYYLVSVD